LTNGIEYRGSLSSGERLHSRGVPASKSRETLGKGKYSKYSAPRAEISSEGPGRVHIDTRARKSDD